MAHHLQHIADLVEICRLKGIQQIVISPGSRNAPLVELFYTQKYFQLHSIVDERSAGYYALGIAIATQKPVALVCTSGTAVLNYSPALAEAYYQHIPLIAITADRPEELIDQQDNQTIRQKNVFQNFVKGSLHLERPCLECYNPKKQHRAVNNIINHACSGIKGPIHINVPIAEPLYVEMPKPAQNIQIIAHDIKETTVSEKLMTAWKSNPKRMIVCGEMLPDPELDNMLNAIANENKTVVLAESISNIGGERIISEIERLIIQIDPENKDFYPDILISFGGPVVSKSLKKWLKKQEGIIHFRIAEEEDKIDTYNNITGYVKGNLLNVLEQLNETNIETGNFSEIWHKAYNINSTKHINALQQIHYSDLKVYETLINLAPENCILHLGNSSPVRYAQLFDLSKFDQVYANRGVSGIDGCLSTATGFASLSKKTNIVILGDLGFLYDSNALWNNKLPHNLKIVIINNDGGGIFRIIPGPTGLKAFEEFIETSHSVSFEKLAEAFRIEYFEVKNENEQESVIQRFMESENSTSLLEIKTPQTDNAEVFKKYIESIMSEAGYEFAFNLMNMMSAFKSNIK